MFPELGEVWEPVDFFCSHHNVTYAHRVDNPGHYNWCVVPQSGQDAVLYGAIAVLLGCLVSGKLSSVWILVAGGVLEYFANEFNLLHLSNATALWMGINPPDVFLYVFLPPLLLDSAIRIDFFTFRKVASQVMTFAVLAVLGMVVIVTPLLIYAFDLTAAGWHWSHAALFVCMIASTDAVAVTAVLKKANGPETLGVLMEGESLFNDATSIVLFELMLSKVKEVEAGVDTDEHLLLQMGYIAKSMAILAGGGALCGLVAGYLTTKIMRVLRLRGMPEDIEVAVTVAVSYLVYYVTNAPLHLSGVTAVVVFGLYGSATLKWDMSASAASQSFPAFWNVLGQITNTVVFFFSGAACVNFVLRSTTELQEEGAGSALAVTLFRLPIIFLAIMAARLLLIAAFSPMLNLFGAKLDWRGIVLCTVGGLRGALCLIMVQTTVLDIGADGNPDEKLNAVKSSLALWTTGVVLGTLFINAPALSFILRVTGLTKVSLLTLQTRNKARRQFLRFTDDCVRELQKDEDELLQGVDWAQVRQLIDCSVDLRELVAPGGTEDLFSGAAYGELLPDVDSDDAEDLDGSSDSASMLSDTPEESPAVPSIGPQLVDASKAATAAGSTAGSVPSVPPSLLTTAEPADAGVALTGTDSTASEHGNGHAAAGSSAARAAPRQRIAEVMNNVIHAGGADLATQGKQQGLPIEVVASLDDASRRKLVEKLNGQCQISVGNEVASEAFSLTRKSSVRPQGPRDSASAATASMPPSRRGSVGETIAMLNHAQVAETVAAAESLRQPLLPDSTQLDLSDTNQTDAKEASVKLHDSADTGIRKEPYVAIIDAAAGFAAPPLPERGASAELSVQSGHTGSIAAQSATMSRAHSAPFSSPLATARARRARSVRSGAIGDMQPHHLSALPAGAMRRLQEEMLAEQRMRLIAGMKRYAHRKRHEGLLSGHGLRMFEHACDSSMDTPERPINVFGRLHADFAAGATIWAMSWLHFRLRSMLMGLRHVRWLPLRAALMAPVRAACRMLSVKLSDRMLLALEVAIELWLALTFSMEARIVVGDVSAGEHDRAVRDVLRQELERQKAEVWDFILDRHLEAPDRFRAIQTYRAAMALMAQQRQFVLRLYNSGMLTEAERELVEDAVETRERALRERGAAWNPPTLTASLRALPFLADVSDALFEEIVLQGRMATYGQDEIIAAATAETGDATFVGIILSGLATTHVAPCRMLQAGAAAAATAAAEGGHTGPEAFLTHGSVFGLLGTLTGVSMPGRSSVVAHSEMRATHVFEIPKHVVESVRAQGRAGDTACAKLMRALYRLAAIQVVERFQGVLLEVVAAWLRQKGRCVAGDGTTAVRRAADRWKAKAQHGEDADQAPVNVQLIWAALRGVLPQAQVVEVEAGGGITLRASAVLVSGSMVTEGAGSTAKGPCVLVWPDFKPADKGTDAAELKVTAGEEGAVIVAADAGQEFRCRRQFQASKVVMGHLKSATGSHKLSAAQRATLGVNDGYFVQHGSMASTT
eukprot:jgi/Ulvmu1/498/UM001_0506.1